MDGTIYVTVVQWPDALDDEGQVELLIRATGLDPFMAKQRVAHGVPAVLLRTDEAAGRDMVHKLESAGAMAIGLTPGEIGAAPEPKKAKRLMEAVGAPKSMYMVEYWRGESDGLLCADVFLLVRGRIDRSQVRVQTGSSGGASMLATTMVVGPLGAMAMGMGGQSSTTRTTTLKISHVIDLYTRSGRRVRIDADKFNFDVLGGERGLTNLENADRLALKLAGECKGAMVDTNFGNFRVAPELVHQVVRDLAGTTVTRRDEGPAFELYSVWSWYLHRRLMAR